MPSLPIAHEQEQESEGAIPGACPYSPSEIGDYLTSGQRHYLTREPVVQFSVGPASLVEKRLAQRAYWVRSANDTLGREWFILVGSGRSPFDPMKAISRWMLAETNDDASTPDDFLSRQIAEQAEHDQLKSQTTH